MSLVTNLKARTPWIVLCLLFCVYLVYSFETYSAGAGSYDIRSAQAALDGQLVWQDNNCQACHQIYGLGGYLGPDLTNVVSDANKGERYVRAVIENGTARMPSFALSATAMDHLVSYLKQVDGSGRSSVDPQSIDDVGNYHLQRHKHE